MNPFESIQPHQLVGLWYMPGLNSEPYYRFRTVARVTKQHIIVDGGYYSRKTGRITGPGAPESTSWIEKPAQPR